MTTWGEARELMRAREERDRLQAKVIALRDVLRQVWGDVPNDLRLVVISTLFDELADAPQGRAGNCVGIDDRQDPPATPNRDGDQIGG